MTTEMEMGTDLHTTIGENIRIHRMRLGLTQEELGKKAGYSERLVWQMENALTNFKITSLIDVCGALGVEVKEII